MVLFWHCGGDIIESSVDPRSEASKQSAGRSVQSTGKSAPNVTNNNNQDAASVAMNSVQRDFRDYQREDFQSQTGVPVGAASVTATGIAEAPSSSSISYVSSAHDTNRSGPQTPGSRPTVVAAPPLATHPPSAQSSQHGNPVSPLTASPENSTSTTNKKTIVSQSNNKKKKKRQSKTWRNIRNFFLSARLRNHDEEDGVFMDSIHQDSMHSGSHRQSNTIINDDGSISDYSDPVSLTFHFVFSLFYDFMLL